jgi:membrane fusion protein, multidrug efflux system
MSTQLSEATKPSRSRFRWLMIAIAVIVVAVAIFAWISYSSGRERTDDAQVDGHIVPVASKIYGNVVEVLVKDNQSVKAGDAIVRIDPRDYQLKVDQAKAALTLAESHLPASNINVPLTRDTTQSMASNSMAQLAVAENELARTKLSYELAATSDLAAARATVEARQASSDRAQADLARMKPLAAKSEISKQQLDAYEAAARVAASDLKAAQEKLSSAVKDAEIKKAAINVVQAQVERARAEVDASKANLKKVDISASDVVSVKAAIAQAKTNLEAAELQLSYTTVVAPEDGVVTKKTVEIGQVVQPGQSMMMIVPLHKVWITANFKETQLADVKPGQRAEIDVDMYGKTIIGKVDSLAGATGTRLSLLPPENATGNFVKVVQRIPVKIVLDQTNDTEVLRPGMNVVVTIITK